MAILKSKEKKIFLLIAIVILISLTLLTVYQHFTIKTNNLTNNLNNKPNTGKRSFASLKGLSFTETVDNETAFKINAQKAYVRNRKLGFFRVALQKVTEMEDVKVNLFENGKEITSIRSDYSTLYAGTKNVLFEGNVTCSTKEGKTLKTEKLFWDNKRKILKTEGGYIYTAKDGSMKNGTGFESDNKLETIKFSTERLKTVADRRVNR